MELTDEQRTQLEFTFGQLVEALGMNGQPGSAIGLLSRMAAAEFRLRRDFGGPPQIEHLAEIARRDDAGELVCAPSFVLALRNALDARSEREYRFPVFDLPNGSSSGALTRVEKTPAIPDILRELAEALCPRVDRRQAPYSERTRRDLLLALTPFYRDLLKKASKTRWKREPTPSEKAEGVQLSAQYAEALALAAKPLPDSERRRGLPAVARAMAWQFVSQSKEPLADLLEPSRFAQISEEFKKANRVQMKTRERALSRKKKRGPKKSLAP
ncbi:MAG: hypothetical protein L6R30_11980 [Thermoanaerobaculia bacterium]|nr:hypothetical protein [Thermoanaerobaculia bacterium]